MRTVTISMDEATWIAAQQMAAAEAATLDDLLARLVQSVAARSSITAEQQAEARRELARTLAECGAEIGETPTRERTYRGRRFS